MKTPEFILQENKGYLRLLNWKDYIKSVDIFNVSKKNEFAIMTVTYNNTDNVKTLLEALKDEKERDNMDYIIIDNSTNDGIKKENKQLCSYYENVIYIESIGDIGADGGCALGMEYALHNGYEYINILEDDVILLDADTLSEVYKNRGENKIIFINESKNTSNGHSRYVHFGCYPSNFLKRSGVTDPRFFIRSGDLEWSERIEKAIKKYNYERITTNKDYLHPYMKKGNGKIRWIYFSIRNQLFMNEKHFSWNKRPFLGTIFFYIRYGISKFLIERSNSILKVLFFSLTDFILNKRGIRYNTIREKQFNSLIMSIPVNTTTKEVSFDELQIYTKNKYLITAYNVFSERDVKKLVFSKKICDFFGNGVMIGGFFSPVYPLFILAKNIVSIDEFDLLKDRISISIIENKFHFKYIKVLIGLLLSVIMSVVLLPILLVKVGLHKIFYCIRTYRI